MVKKWKPKPYWSDDDIVNECLALEEWLSDDSHVWVDDFALSRGYNPKMYHILKRRSDEFSELLQIADKRAESTLIRKGMEANPGRMVDKILDKHHGWSQPVQVAISDTLKAKAIEDLEVGS